jgi:ABC-2 type transport system ATP-binding protein
MRATLRQLKDEGKTVFINSHLLQEIELVCDRVAILVKGELRREGLVESITQRREPELELTLAGNEPAIRTTLGDWPIAEWSSEAEKRYRVLVKIGDQSEVDRCVDRLRTAGVSIVELVRRRDTLEEAFLGIVSEKSPKNPIELA